MTKAHFTGAIVPLATPFDDHGGYADGALRRPLDYLSDAGVHGDLGTANFVPQIARAWHIWVLLAACAVDLATFFEKVVYQLSVLEAKDAVCRTRKIGRDALRGGDLMFQPNGASSDLCQATLQFKFGAP